ncbi:hypothetical protein [Aquimarina agarivorans]|uniref:hypothetical protein n=1 Tax=Aquimarina agarivorans TaxID=980584 RepID=UPI000303D6A2|nr:hypothetical protein [Aquimarina agarivorans]
MLDITWASGYLQGEEYINEFRDIYFLKTPTEFIADHMPFDPLMQFLNQPINNTDFIAHNFSESASNGSFLFDSLLKQHEALDELKQLENLNDRIIKNGIVHKLIQDQVDENNYQITVRKYNLAVKILNNGITTYNSYVSSKNKRFRNPKLNDSQIKKLMSDIDSKILTANSAFNKLISANRELNNKIIEARKRMPELLSGVSREKLFVSRYLNKWKPFRIFMF